MQAQIIALDTSGGHQIAALARHGLPDQQEAWLLGNPDGGYDPGLQETFSAALSRISGHGPWRWPNRVTHFLADPHADAEAFETSLLATGGVQRAAEDPGALQLTAAGSRAHFIIGGDCLDKGPSNLDLLRSIRRFQHCGPRLTLLAGNHDVRFLVGLRALELDRDPRTEHLFLRMGPKVVPLLEEIHREYLRGRHSLRGLPGEKQCKQRLYPSASWFDNFPEVTRGLLSEAAIDKEARRLHKKLDEFAEACDQARLSMRCVYAVALKARELFLKKRGEFGWFFRDMQLACLKGSFLFIHAGLDDEIAQLLARRNMSVVNRQYQKLLKQDLLTFYFGPIANTMRTKYRKTDLPLSAAGVDALHRAGIYAVVHGHRNRLNGQRLMLRKDLLHIESDITMDRRSRKKEGNQGIGIGVTTILPEGQVLGISNDYPAIKVFEPGTIT